MSIIKRPIGNLNGNAWIVSTYTNVSDNVIDPALPDTVEVFNKATNAELQLDLGTFDSTANISIINVHVYGRRQYSSNPIDAQLRILVGSTWSSYITLNTPDSSTQGGGGWKKYQFFGPFSVTSSTALGLGINTTFASQPGNNIAAFSAIYVEISDLTYTGSGGVSVSSSTKIGRFHNVSSNLISSGNHFLRYYNSSIPSGIKITDLLIGHFRLNEGTGTTTTSDEGYIGTLTNSPTWQTDRPNAVHENSHSLLFDNTNPVTQYVIFDSPTSDYFNFGTSDFTISCWMKPDSVQNFDFTVAVSKIDITGRVLGWSLGCAVSGPDIVAFGILNWSAPYGPGSAGTLITGGGSPINDGNWHLVTLTKDSKNITFYVDGSLVNTDDHTDYSIDNTLSMNNTAPLCFGAEGVTLDSTFNYRGGLDDIRIYQRSLSATEIASLYTDSLPSFTALARLVINGYGLASVSGSANCAIVANQLHYVASGTAYVDDANFLIGHWNCDEGTSNILNDQTLRANHGQLSNMSNSNWSTDVTTKIKSDKYSLNFTNNNVLSTTPQFIYFDDTASNNFNFDTSDFSISFWLKCPNPTPQNNSEVTLISKDGSSGWNIGLKVTTAPTYRLFYSFSWNGTTASGSIVSIHNISNGNWHNVIVLKSSTQLSFYINGTISSGANITSASASNTISISNSSQLRFGNKSNYDNISTFNFLGKLDEIKIYKKLLTNAEITALSSGYAPKTAIASVSSIFVKYTASGDIAISGTSRIGVGVYFKGGISISNISRYGVSIASSGGVSVGRQAYVGIKIQTSGGITLSGKCRPGVSVKSLGGILINSNTYFGIQVKGNGGIVINSSASTRYTTLGASSMTASGGMVISSKGIVRVSLSFTLGARESITKYPGTATDVGGGSFGLTNLNNILTDNNVYANLLYNGSSTRNSNVIKLTNFGFNLPSNTVIHGLIASLIDTRIAYSGGTSSGTVAKMSLVLSNVVQTYNHASSESISTTNFINVPYGDTNDVWSTTFNPTVINDSTFGMAFQVRLVASGVLLGTYNIDSATIALSYTIPISLAGSGYLRRGFISIGNISLNGTFDSKITNFKYISKPETITISGNAIPVVVTNTGSIYYTSGGSTISGSAKVLFYNYIGGQGSLNVSGNMSGGWTYRLISGKKQFTWSDDFNRVNNTNIG